jgi:hypothetical protein
MRARAILLGLAVSAFAGAAQAQFTIGALRETLNGDGRLVVTGQSSSNVSSAVVYLGRDKRRGLH